MRKIIIAAVACSIPQAGYAHGSAPQAAAPGWTIDPWIVTPLVLFGLMYGIGRLMLARKGRKDIAQDVICGAGWLALTTALVSPLHWLGERLLSFHMIEHEILMAVAAPLLVISRPVGPLLWSLPRPARLAIGRAMRHPLATRLWSLLSAGGNATLLHGIAIWAWHVPVLFDAAAANVLLHRMQHLSFFLTAILFWWSVFRRSQTGSAAWHVFVTMLHTSILGALMALAPRLLYRQQADVAVAWDLTPLEDQQLAGIIMWVPAGTIYAGAALALIALWIRRAGQGRERTDALHAL
ncbi:cytochrome c oxidase assembly protein [Bradyrhizobium glycinis]|uniref:cytochrome c oxidase assembly protein n=1 Tax=Bradyrhizobium glycinis TaxID=2751812 RepID=UPI0018D64FF9|nr:cytochrome c oxidase assembly protein [Bradyrhizobium glycinis]MBH5367872.1 cytochrome c oxidase assembly protein [Bradyrhizobium glycinis]